MAYDSPKYQAKQVMQIRGTFAAILGTTAAKSATSANIDDRVEFFRKVKLTGFKALSKIKSDAGAHATSHTMHLRLCQGTVIKAAAVIGTVAGVMADGSIVVSTLSSGTACNLRFNISGWDGTVTTLSPNELIAFVEYQERL